MEATKWLKPSISVAAFPERVVGSAWRVVLFEALLGVHSRCGLHTRAATNS